MSLLQHGLTPRLKPLSARRSATLSVLDIGTSKVVCLVAELQPVETLSTLRGRTHLARIIGIGHQRSGGLKGGAVVDLEAAETAIRQAVHAAERMARVEVQSVIVSLSGGRLGSQHFDAKVPVRTGAVTGSDVQRVLEAASTHSISPGRAVLHALPTGYSLDQQSAVVDPSGMLGERLGVDLHVVTAEIAAARNLMLAVENTHLRVEAVIATPTPRVSRRWSTTRPRWVWPSSTWAAARRASGSFPAATSSIATRSRSAATTSPWTSPAGSPPGWRRPSGSRPSTAPPWRRRRTSAT